MDIARVILGDQLPDVVNHFLLKVVLNWFLMWTNFDGFIIFLLTPEALGGKPVLK